MKRRKETNSNTLSSEVKDEQIVLVYQRRLGLLKFRNLFTFRLYHSFMSIVALVPQVYIRNIVYKFSRHSIISIDCMWCPNHIRQLSIHICQLQVHVKGIPKFRKMFFLYHLDQNVLCEIQFYFNLILQDHVCYKPTHWYLVQILSLTSSSFFFFFSFLKGGGAQIEKAFVRKEPKHNHLGRTNTALA